MGQGRSRLVRRVGQGFLLLAVVVGVWAGFNRTELQTRYTTFRLKRASADADRNSWADALAARGEAGLGSLIDLVRAGDPACRAAAAAALDRYLTALPDGDSRVVILCGRILDAFPECDETARDAIIDLLPTILKRGGAAHALKCRDMVSASLKMARLESRLTGIRAAMHPALRMRTDLLPLLSAAEPEVRRATLFAIGPATDVEPVLSDEEIFVLLHDPDEGVQKIGHESLLSRGRSEAEISRGRRLTQPDAAERLKLLLDLRYDDDLVDPEPWLERLSRDVDPGVRAGAARVIAELAGEHQQSIPVWVGRLADADSDPTVRRIARFYWVQALNRKTDQVRPVGGP